MSIQSSEFAIQPILCTADIGRLRSFYVELFGAEEEMRVPGEKGPFFLELRLGRARLGPVDHQAGAEAEPGRVTVAVFVDSVDDLVPQVAPAGGKVLGPARDMPWGHRVAHITDPDGNMLNLTQRL